MMPISALSRVVVEIDGAPIVPAAARALGEVRVQRQLSLPTLCELTFFDPAEPFVSECGVERGAHLKVTIEAETIPLFRGQVTAVKYAYGPSGGREIRVRGYDLLYQLRKSQPLRAHVDVTLIDLARNLVRNLGLEVQATEPGPVWQKLVQYRQSDFEMIAEVAERCGLYFTLNEGVLQFMTLEGIGPTVSLELGRSLLEAQIDVNTDLAFRSVETLSWDPWRAKHHRGEASRARIGREIPSDAASDEIQGRSERILADEPFQEERQAEALAQSEMDRQSAGEVTLWGIALGDSRLRPGTPVDVGNVASPILGRYILTSVTHTLDRHRGFLSEINTVPPPVRARAKQTLASLGTVTQVNDPDGLGRVRVLLPSYGGIETDWLGVVLPGAGAGKGLVAIPDVNDQVLVLFIRDDPAQGIVLGGLYGSVTPPDKAGVGEGGIHRFSFLTPGGQRIQLNDDKKMVQVENHSGDRIELSPGRVRLVDAHGSRIELLRDKVCLHAEADLEIEAPGKRIVIRGRFIDFERG